MKEALLSLVALGGVFALLSHVLPEREEVRRALSLLFSVLLLTLLFRPFLSGEFFRPLEEWENEVERGDVSAGAEYLEEARQNAVREGIREDLCNAFELTPENVTVDAVFNTDFSFSRLTVSLAGKDAYKNLVAIEAYGRKNYDEIFEVRIYGQ